MFTTRENLLLYLQSLPATLMVGGITIAVTLVLARGMYWLVEAPALSLRPLFRVPAQQPV
jgi:peptidoglycan/LPS O-acetylase OafA/YrhL